MPNTSPLSRDSIRRNVLLGFGFVLALLAMLPFIVLINTAGYRLLSGQMSSSYGIIRSVDSVLRLLAEADRELLRQGPHEDNPRKGPIKELSAQIQKELDLLLTGTATSPVQLSRCTRLRSLLTEHMALWQPNPLAYPSKTKAAALKTNAQQVALLLDEIRTGELNQLESAEKNGRKAGRISTLVITSGTGLTLLILIAAARIILRDIAAHRRSQEVLADHHNLLSSILDTIPDNIFVKDVKGRFIMSNRAHRKFHEFSEDDPIEGKTVFDIYPYEDAVQYAAADQIVLDTGLPVRNLEERVRPRSGGEIWLLSNKAPLVDPSGRTLGLVCAGSDITARKHAEMRLQSFASQLERSNAELQSFASVASHDLQEPLRKIQAFADRLRMKCADQLGPAGLDYLSRMEKAAERMRGLIQDLLQLSRVTSRAQPFEPVDLHQIVTEVLGDLEIAVEKAGASISVEPLPVIDADPVQMRQLFQNLIGNALKFRRSEVPPKIHIRCSLLPDSERPNHCQLEFEDNGIGFEPKFAEQIFVVFQRLHGRGEYEGSGIGLAVCRKITDRHGGTIRAESSLNVGTRFSVSLPIKQSSSEKTFPS
jgi:PAS domain S-box-containing protein